MHFRIEQRVAAPLLEVEAALVDPAFLDHLGSLPKLGRPTLLDQREDGDLLHQRVRYAFAGDLSSAVRRVIDPAKLTWVEDSTLDRRTHRTEFRILPDHYADRLRCSGVFVLQEGSDDRCLRTAEGELKVTVPLVGGKVEGAIVSGLREHADAEAQMLEQWLTTRKEH